MRYLAYARFSPRKDADKCVSCDVQLADIRDWVRKIDPNAVILEFRDDDISGKTLKRPGLEKAFQVMRRGDVLIVRDWDRLARNLYVQLKIARNAERKKCEMHAIYGGPWRDTKDPAIRLLSNMLASVAEYQRECISLKTSAKMKQHQAEGRLMGSKPPYGYDIKVKLVGNRAQRRLVPNKEQQYIISRMQHFFDRGYNGNQIAASLQAEGHRNLDGTKVWRPSTIRNILKREHDRKMILGLTEQPETQAETPAPEAAQAESAPEHAS